jgi:hypothetical protein
MSQLQSYIKVRVTVINSERYMSYEAMNLLLLYAAESKSKLTVGFFAQNRIHF